MVKISNPFRRKKAQTFDDKEMAKELKIESGLTRIKGTEYLRKRIEFIQEPFIEMQRQLEKQIMVLLEKDSQTPRDEELLKNLNQQLFNLFLHKTNKMVATAWSRSGEDKDMSERYSALEEFFRRNWNDPEIGKLLMDAELYMLDISFLDKHGEPAPHILVQTPMMGSPRIDLSDIGRTKKEEIS